MFGLNRATNTGRGKKGKKQFCSLYYKHMMIVNEDSSIVSEQSFLLIDDVRGIIYDRRMFIIQATG